MFGNLYGAVGVAAGFSYVAGGPLLDAASAPLTFAAAGAGGCVVTVAVALTLPGALRRTALAAGGGGADSADGPGHPLGGGPGPA